MNATAVVMKLRRGKLLKLPEWSAWHLSEHKKPDQYNAQGMFGNPVPWEKGFLVFNPIWTY